MLGEPGVLPGQVALLKAVGQRNVLNHAWMCRLLLPAEVYALLLPQLMPAFSHEPINMRDASCIGACFKNGGSYSRLLPHHQSSSSLLE